MQYLFQLVLWKKHTVDTGIDIGSLLCSERFFSGYSGFPLSLKTNISKFQFDPGLHGHFWTSSCELLGASWVNKLHTFTSRTAWPLIPWKYCWSWFHALWFQIPGLWVIICKPWSRPFIGLWSPIPYTPLRPCQYIVDKLKKLVYLTKLFWTRLDINVYTHWKF